MIGYYIYIYIISRKCIQWEPRYSIQTNKQIGQTGQIQRSLFMSLLGKRLKVEDLLNYLLAYYLLTYLLQGAVLQKVTGSQLVKKFPYFMNPKSSLPHPQVPTTCPCPKPDRSPYPTSHFLRTHLNIFLPSVPGYF